MIRSLRSRSRSECPHFAPWQAQAILIVAWVHVAWYTVRTWHTFSDGCRCGAVIALVVARLVLSYTVDLEATYACCERHMQATNVMRVFRSLQGRDKSVCPSLTSLFLIRNKLSRRGKKKQKTKKKENEFQLVRGRWHRGGNTDTGAKIKSDCDLQRRSMLPRRLCTCKRIMYTAAAAYHFREGTSHRHMCRCRDFLLVV